MTEKVIAKVPNVGISCSEKTRAKQREKAFEQGKTRAAEVEAKVKRAMTDIEAEMRENHGIYPYKGGKVSEAEVFRRAGVHPTTVPKNLAVYGNLDKTLKAWKAALQKGENPIDREHVRQTLAGRVENWMKRHDRLMQVHQLTELELQEAQAKLEILLQQSEELKKENQRLIVDAARISTSNVKLFQGKLNIDHD